MELGYLLSSQVILISSILAIISLSESSKTAYSLRCLVELPFIKVSGEKGSILLLFAISSFFVFVIDLISSQAKISGFKTFSKRCKRAKFQHLKNLFVLFVTFICAYIFQSLNFRVDNLFGIALVTTNLNSLMLILGLMILQTWFSVVFILCNILIIFFTFIKGSENIYSFAVSYIKFRT
jgi:hypothetical protein